MNVWEEINALRRDVPDMIRQAVSTVARWNKTTAASADGQTDAVESYALPSEANTQEQTRRVAPWGIAGVPLTGLAGAVIRAMGEASQSILVGIAHPQYARAGLKKGETQLYNKVANCEVFLDENGAILVSVASGQLLKLAGVTDFAIKGTTYRNAEHTYNLALQSAIATATTSVAAAASVADLKAAFATLFSSWTGAITAYEAGATTYLSTKVKLG